MCDRDADDSLEINKRCGWGYQKNGTDLRRGRQNEAGECLS